MFHKNTKKQMYVLSTVSTTITFLFFLGFIYFAFFTGKELLIHAVISQEEYIATSMESYEYFECQNPNSWEVEQYLQNDFALYSDEIMFPEIETLEDLEKINIQTPVNTGMQVEQAMEKCQQKYIQRASMRQSVDFQRNVSKYALAMIFFLVLFLSFSFQSERIYKKMK